jgi:asparagine synthase (glutamine-hydrolysing)
MCGIAALVGPGSRASQVIPMMHRQHHRGPDGRGLYVSPSGLAALGHTRLSIIDLSEAGRQPMASADGRFQLAFNGEIYNYLELRRELAGYPFRTRTDSEVVLAAYERWGPACLDRFLGMFAILLWDERESKLFAARDRFGVKPLVYGTTPTGALAFASEIKALWAAGVPAVPDDETWASYLTYGLHDHGVRTFWRGISSVPAGHALTWTPRGMTIQCWYDLATALDTPADPRSDAEVEGAYIDLLTESIRLRFRSDVPIGIAVSGGLDSGVLLGAIRAAQAATAEVRAFTFVTGDPAYDELPWVRAAVEHTAHPLTVCELRAEDVPALAESVQVAQDEPFGGLPTLAYARVFEAARRLGVKVMLDGQGMDEQWAGYDYYAAAGDAQAAPVVQGTRESPVRPACLVPEFRASATPLRVAVAGSDALRRLQYRDIHHTKIPRALRFNDRVSMRASVELREPFLDHRLVELALRQPASRKIRDGVSKYALRAIARRLMPAGLVSAPKRPVQTPQREWLRGPLREWADAQIRSALAHVGDRWLESAPVMRAWDEFCTGRGDSSFFVWQWISLGMVSSARAVEPRPPEPASYDLASRAVVERVP